MSIRKEAVIGGQRLSIETGKVAKQADGSVLVRLGDTIVLVTATADRRERTGVDFLPLTVDYRENTYAAGKIPGGFFRREGRPNEKEVLTSRVIDRPLRPLFPMPRTAAVLNLDMIGRNEEVPADGGGRFRGLEPQPADSNASSGVRL